MDAAGRARRKFLHYFPRGFRDPTYIDWERGYKWDAHLAWEASLGRTDFVRLYRRGAYREIAERAIRIESRTNLLFSFEKMALRDAVRSVRGARIFAQGLYAFLYGIRDPFSRFDRWCQSVAALPRIKTRVLTWPVVTVFGFIAQPRTHFFLKPLVTRRALAQLGSDFVYASKPSAEAYFALLGAVRRVRRDLRGLRPRDMIDLQSFLWVQGSDEYPD